MKVLATFVGQAYIGLMDFDLRKRRKALGLRQEDLAALLNVSRDSIIRWEAGEVPAHPGMLSYAMDGLEAKHMESERAA